MNTQPTICLRKAEKYGTCLEAAVCQPLDLECRPQTAGLGVAMETTLEQMRCH